jgi:hypothetical protein
MTDQEFWQFINTFSGWFSAVGTIAAVIVALYLARQDKRIRLSVFAGYRVIVTQGDPESQRDYLTIGITNVGHREAQVTTIGWRVGIWRKQYSIQTVMKDGMSSPLPVRLRDGEEARYYIPLTGETRWLEEFAKECLVPNPRKRLLFMWVRVHTSVGGTYTARIEKGLREKLLAFAEQQSL